MAIQCKYCGTNLPKDDARFCNKCGMLVPSHPFSPQSLAALRNDSKNPFTASSDEQQVVHKPVLREQVAELSPVRPTPEPSKQEVQEDISDTGKQKRVKPEMRARDEAARKTDVPETPPIPPQKAFSPEAASRPMSPIVAPRPMPGIRNTARQGPPRPPARFAPVAPPPVAREVPPLPDKSGNKPDGVSSTNDGTVSKLHVKVWEAEDLSAQTAAKDQVIEDMPTRSIVMPVEATQPDVEDMPTQLIASMPMENRYPVQEKPVEEPQSPFLSVPPTQSIAQEHMVEDWRARINAANLANPSLPTPVRVNTPPFTPPPDYQPVRTSGTLPTDASQRSRRRGPILLVVLLLVFLLALGGVGTLVVLSQHATVDPITQPQVSFSNARLGIALKYPNGWTEQVKTDQSTLHLAASGQIGQIDIIVASSGDVKQALQQQAAKMGLSGTKADATLNFAGTDWQQLQGTLQQSGASYTDTILATTHGSQLFIIVQQAPQSNYNNWDQEFFAPLRESFKFL